MDLRELCFLSANELSHRFRDGTLSPVEATRAVLERIRAVDSQLHAYLTVLDGPATARAAEAEREIRAGHARGPLHGVPVAVKDLCQTAGVATTCASRVLRDWVPALSSTVVERLEAAGAVLLGKLNMTEFAVAWYHPELPVPLN